MYEKIVVPLDGSKLAECVLSHAEELACHAVQRKRLSCSALPSVSLAMFL